MDRNVHDVKRILLSPAYIQLYMLFNAQTYSSSSAIPSIYVRLGTNKQVDELRLSERAGGRVLRRISDQKSSRDDGVLPYHGEEKLLDYRRRDIFGLNWSPVFSLLPHRVRIKRTYAICCR